jgi:DNA (cytosine-5)-methyltransferase 1
MSKGFSKNDLTYISLFSSAGIGCYGFKQAGFKCIATNELIKRRIKVQECNNICERSEGYIQGDISTLEIQKKILDEVEFWKKNKGVANVTAIVATPPCQGMSVANHNKKKEDIYRNSLVIESLEMVKAIQPLFFIFENVPAFMTTECEMRDGKICSINDAHYAILSDDYLFYDDTINFMHYGANSSRTRTLVIGIHKKLSRFISAVELFPDREEMHTLRTVIGDLPSLSKMGEISNDDIFHFFRAYPSYMRQWIHNLGEGESAFDNINENDRPYKIGKDKTHIPLINNSGGKYTRQRWDTTSLIIHTRNDQLASQNTIHPSDDRVLSIREIMLLMTIPDSFKWVDDNINALNQGTIEKKKRFLRSIEGNIRQCIGEAVPTIILYKIALNISDFLKSKSYSDQTIKRIISDRMLSHTDNMLQYLDENLATESSEATISRITLSRFAELANTSRDENAAYYTEKGTLTYIFEYLPHIESDIIRILEPSVGTGNFIPFLVKKYSYAEKLIIDVVDIDNDALMIAEKLLRTFHFPENVEINFYCIDFMDFNMENRHYHLAIGNPPYIRMHSSTRLDEYRRNTEISDGINISTFFFAKCSQCAEYVAFIMPKIFLGNSEYIGLRNMIRKKRIEIIIDFGEKGFSGIHIETIFLLMNSKRKAGKTMIVSVPQNKRLRQKQSYITDTKLPNWVIYRDDKFDDVLSEKVFGVFCVFRDRQITKSNTTFNKKIWVITSKNIPRNGLRIIKKNEEDIYIEKEILKGLGVFKYYDMDDVYLVPNMTYYPRMVQKPKKTVVNGSVAILIPNDGVCVTEDDIRYIASDEFERFYRIARNCATRSINIDNISVYYFPVCR